MIRQILKAFFVGLGLALAFTAGAFAQTSSGADGAYIANVSGDFDPNNLSATCTTCTTNNVVNAAGDNVFNFTSITINSGVSIRLRASKVRNMPVVWLATGNVTINGIVNLNGDGGYTLNATDPSQIIATRRPAEPGAGGYYGGLGSRGGVGPESGAGPGGGVAGQNTAVAATCRGGEASSYLPGYSGWGPPVPSTYGNFYLVPLYGGSGGGGGWGANVNDVGGGGGAGGGAIRIVSPTQIALNSPGDISVSGGAFGTNTNGSSTYCGGGPGSAGAIHLIAPTITGNGTLVIYDGVQPGGVAGYADGFVRFNVTNFNFTGTVSQICSGAACASNTLSNVFVGPYYQVPPNSTLTQPSLSITTINNVNVPTPPLGQYLSPDVQINTNNPVNVVINATNIPVGTVVTLRVTSELNGDQSITCPALAGTLAQSTATCTATFPFSVSLSTVRATW